MNRPLVHHFVIFFVVAGTFLSTAALANANTFSFPQQYHYTGLTFSNPLTYTKPLPNTQSTTIAFHSEDTLQINKDDTMKPLESIVITPAATDTTDQTTTPDQPTPTIYVQPSGEVLAAHVGPISPTTATTAQLSNTPTTPSYTPVPQSNAGGLNASDLFSMVNAYRASQGLPAFQQDAKTCSLAQERAPVVAGEIAAGDMHAGLKAMDIPYWNTENIISMNSDQAAFSWWLGDPIHHAAIVSSATYSCVACSGNSCAEEFTSYAAK